MHTESNVIQGVNMSTQSEALRSADRVVSTVARHGVKYIFGIPGAKVDAIFDALEDGGPELIVCRHEQNAAFMAGAIGRLTGVPGVVLVTSGPGTTNLATGLLTANTEQDPVVALAGSVQLSDRLKRTHQSMDAAAFLSTVTKSTVESTDADDVSEAVANAFRAAIDEPKGAAAVVLSASVLKTPTTFEITDIAPKAQYGPAVQADITRAAELIKAAETPVLLVGLRGATDEATAAVRSLLTATGLPIVETFQAAGVVSRELEDQYIGRVGLFQNQPGDLVLYDADVVVTIGYDAVEYDPVIWNEDVSRTIIHLDVVSPDMDNHYQPTLELRGDIAATVDALVPLLDGLVVSEQQQTRLAAHRAALAALDDEARATPDSDQGVNPAALVLRMRELLDDDATVAVDMGSNYIFTARHFRVYEPRHILFSNGQQTLGVAMPWAIAASLVRPGTHVVSISGDGGFLFSVQELETATRLGVTFTHVIMRDNTYNMVAFQEELKYGRTSGIQLGDYDSVALAEAFGAKGHKVTTLDEFSTVFSASLNEPGVSIIDIWVDYSKNTDIAKDLPEDAFE